MEREIPAIANKSGFRITSHRPVIGGDISQGFCVTGEHGKLMLKLNEAGKYPGMFERESEGLHWLAKAAGLKVPAVKNIGIHMHCQYMWLEWMDAGTPGKSFWEDLAIGLGKIHRQTSELFGWHSNNYIGSLVQLNDRSPKWSLFYAAQRIMPLVVLLYNSKVFNDATVKDAESMCNRLPGLFPTEPPALLHGDLWSGNFMAVASEDGGVVPAVFDPAVYFGHREMDLGMSLLFGGFDNRFYASYESNFDLDKQWRKRVSLTQLYPLLVHAVLFGGSYISRCKTIFEEWR